ncbi:Cu+-exporting ATPase [Parelusimicrobium proximum]|uniref:heavy metal translocating P-type ATPase n=1 Tax=Parelusimicrobium proximum TaxID=3228953 RepID=UPI003D17A8A2
MKNKKNKVSASSFISPHSYKIRFYISLVFFTLILISFYLKTSPFTMLTLSILGAAAGGGLIFKAALQDIRKLFISEDFFISFSVICAVIYGMVMMIFPIEALGGIDNLFLESALLVCVANWVKSSRGLEKEKSREFIDKIDDFAPKSARLLTGKEEKKVFASEILPGSRVLVKRGERIPVDGVIESGVTEIEESLITGNIFYESKKKGDTVYAGTLNLSSDIYITVSKLAEASELHRILRVLKESEQERAAKVFDMFRYGKYFFSSAFALAFIVCFILFMRAGYANAPYYLCLMLFFLFFISPAPALMARPLSAFFIKRGAYNNDIGLRDSNNLRVFEKADIIFFDKTGTITYGELNVAEVRPSEGHTAEDLMQVIAGLSEKQDDSFTRGIKKYLRTINIKKAAFTSVNSIPGKGSKGKDKKKVVLAGVESYMREEGVEVPAVSSKGWVIHAAKGGEYLGYIVLSDRLRPETKETIESIKAESKAVVLLSGDGENVVRDVAEEAGIEEYHAPLLPEQKAEFVLNAKAGGKSVAMVGDGFNDVMAMLRSDISVAYAGRQNYYANWADILINSTDITAVYGIMKMYRKYRSVIIENIIIGFLCSVSLLVYLFLRDSAAPQFTCLYFILAGMFLVIINSVRLLKIRL